MSQEAYVNNVKRQDQFEGTCTSFLGCFFDISPAQNRESAIAPSKPVSRRASVTQEKLEPCPDEELLDDLELVLEGRGLVSTLFLPSKDASESSSSSIPRTAFIRCKKGDSKVECQVVVDNNLVSNGTLKRFKFSTFDVLRVSKGRDRNSLIPAVVDDSLIMRFTIVKKGELHFVFESQHVRDDIVQGFKLLIAKKKRALQKLAAVEEDDNVKFTERNDVSSFSMLPSDESKSEISIAINGTPDEEITASQAMQ